MANKRYNIIYTGKFVEGLKGPDVLRNLSVALKSSPQKVRIAFKGKGALIFRNLDEGKARRYLAMLKKAGAICKPIEIKPKNFRMPTFKFSKRSTRPFFYENLSEREQWVSSLALAFPAMMIIGFFLPLYKFVTINHNVLIWPWNLMGYGGTEEQALALPMLENLTYLPLYSILPLILGCMGMLGAYFLRGVGRAYFMLLLGLASVLAFCVIFINEAKVFSIIFLPHSTAVGVMFFIAILCSAGLATVNHLRKHMPASKELRVMGMICGWILILLTLITMFTLPWRSPGIKIVYVSIVIYGVMGVMGSRKKEYDLSMGFALSMLARSILVVLPLCAIATYDTSIDPYNRFVYGNGGGTLSITLSTLKCFLIFYGSLLMMTLGLTRTMDSFVISRAKT